MRLVFAFSLLLVFSLVSQSGFSQKEIEANGMKYTLHTVAKKETVFSLCQKYKITPADLEAANPGLGAILQAGSTIKIPVGKVALEPQKKETPATQASEGDFYYHKVAKRQTLFSIARQYGITANDVIRFNPEASNGLTVGQILKIPVNNSSTENQPAIAGPAKANDSSGFSVHKVVADETIYGLEKRYQLPHEEMLKWNPELLNGLKTGMNLRIPSKPALQRVSVTESKQALSKHQVAKGETLFSLATRFGVDVGELKKANPDLYSRSLETGETIIIPQHIIVSNNSDRESETNQAVNQSSEMNESEISTDCLPVQENKFRKYKVALLLPLYLPEDNESDPTGINKSLLVSPIVFNNQPIPISTDTSMVINGTKIDPRATGFLEFYEGAALAIDSMKRAGMNVELYVFDASTQNQVNQLIQMDEFRDLSLIIGPVYPELQQTVAGFAAKNRIPMVSPLSSAGDFERTNSWFFKVNSTKNFQIEQTAAYIANEFMNRNFFLIEQKGSSGAEEARLAGMCKENLTRKPGRNLFYEINFQQQGVNDIEPMLDPQGENIFLIPNDNEAQVSVDVANLNSLAEKYNIVLMGTTALPKMKSIQTENYHRVRLRYLSPYFVDYNKPLVRRMTERYRDIFSAEPTPYSYQGFDVSYYFLSALFRFGQDFRNCIPSYPMELTQMDFDFRKMAPMGGFMNEGLFVTAYERNFDILNYGTYNSQKSR